jgi:chromosome partitioning protein
MVRVVSFLSEKGGVGKTTACYHIAIGLHRFHSKRVLAVDADYQRGGLSGRFFPDVIEAFGSGSITGTTLYHKFQQLYSASQLTSDVDVRRWRNEIDVIVADPRLSNVSVHKLPATNNIRQNNLSLLGHLQVVDKVLSGLASSYDYIPIDAHPEVSDVLRSILYASDYVVSPCKLDRQSSIGVATVVAEMNNVNADVEMIRAGVSDTFEYEDTAFAGTIGMMCREYGGELKQTEALEYNRLKRAGPVFEVYVTEGDGLRQAAAARVPVFEISIPNADKQGAQFKELVTEFLRRCP